MSNVQTLADYRKQTERFIPKEVVEMFDFDAQIAHLDERMRALLPINEPTRTEMRKARNHLMLAKAGYYERVPLEPLSWRNKLGQPSLALFDVTSTLRRFEFGLIGNRWADTFEHEYSINPTLPVSLRTYYADMEEHLKGRIRGIFGQLKKVDVVLSTTFMGCIPESVEAEIRKAQESNLFTHIYLVMEAPNWEYMENPTPIPQLDPLVVGYTHGEFILITAFDLTTVEESLYNAAYTIGS